MGNITPEEAERRRRIEAEDEAARPGLDKKYAHKYEFNVNMSCGGCSNAIEKKLGRIFKPHGDAAKKLSPEEEGRPDGDYIVRHWTSRAEAWTNDVEYPKILQEVVSTRKKVNSGMADGESRPIAV